MSDNQVTDEDFQLAVQVIGQWHTEQKLSFALVNSGSILVAKQGSPLTLEACLRHAYELVHADTAMAVHANLQAAQQRLDGELKVPN
jgi:hypothetical protein